MEELIVSSPRQTPVLTPRTSTKPIKPCVLLDFPIDELLETTGLTSFFTRPPTPRSFLLFILSLLQTPSSLILLTLHSWPVRSRFKISSIHRPRNPISRTAVTASHLLHRDPRLSTGTNGRRWPKTPPSFAPANPMARFAILLARTGPRSWPRSMKSSTCIPWAILPIILGTSPTRATRRASMKRQDVIVSMVRHCTATVILRGFFPVSSSTDLQ